MKVEVFKDKCFFILVVVEKIEKFFVWVELKVVVEEIEGYVSGVIDSEFLGGFINIVLVVVNEFFKDIFVIE